jgi:hypothetical protein
MIRYLLPIAAGLLLLPPVASAQTPAQPAPSASADSAAIRQAALDYIEGWYTADAGRMQRALHPDLAKRAIEADRDGNYWMYVTTADELVRATRLGRGTDVPPERRWTKVTILDIDGNLASVKVESTKLVDYMHLARWEGRWKIFNVFWDGRAEGRPRP